MNMTRASFPLLALVVALSACGSNGPDVDLSEAGQRGHRIFRDNGCAACHGANGEGGVGPTFVGSFGTEVELEDGSTVTVDRAYLTRSITDPQADRHAGYGIQMPENNLSDEEVDAVVDYIVELGDAGGDA